MFEDVFARLASGLVSNSHSIEETVKKCRLEIQNFVDLGAMPSPNYFLQAANHYRKTKNYENEASICELYIELILEYSEKFKPLNEKLAAKIQKYTCQFEARLYKIKYKQLKHYRLN